LKLLHIEDFRTVSLVSNLEHEFCTRKTFIRAKAPECEFHFGYWMSLEEFIIGLQANFVRTERVKADPNDTTEPIRCALFPADGNRWKTETEGIAIIS
jgi:hypothetical protein